MPSSLPRLEDIGQAILELQQVALIQAQPNSDDELDQVVPVVASLRDSLIHHLIQVKAMSKSILQQTLDDDRASTATTNFSSSSLPQQPSSSITTSLSSSSVTAAHLEYTNAATGLLKAIRELFPDALEFSSGLIRSSRIWWKKFSRNHAAGSAGGGGGLQPTNVTDLECILEVTGVSSSVASANFDGSSTFSKILREKFVDDSTNNKSNNNEDGKIDQEADQEVPVVRNDEDNNECDEDADLLSRFSNHGAICEQWWETVIACVCGYSSLAECNPTFVPPSQAQNAAATSETILISATATFALYCLGPPVTSSAEPSAAIVLKRTVSLLAALPLIDATAVVRATARLVVKFLLILAKQKQKSTKKMMIAKQYQQRQSEVAALEHQGSLALHRLFTLLANITKHLDEKSGVASGSSSAPSSSPSSPPQAFLLALVGVREVLSSTQLLDEMFHAECLNWIRKIITCPSNYFASSGSTCSSSAASSSTVTSSNNGSSSSGISTASYSSRRIDLDVLLSSLIFTSLRASRISLSSGVSEHTERTACFSANYFLHLTSLKICSTASAAGVDATTMASSQSNDHHHRSSSSSSSFSSCSHLLLSPSTGRPTPLLQLLRLILLHDGIPFPPPRPTEAHGIYRNFCPHCLRVCMEVRGACSSGTNGLVLSLADDDIAPWMGMLWRDGPNAFVGSATSLRLDSPSRRTAMPRDAVNDANGENGEIDGAEGQEEKEEEKEKEEERLVSSDNRSALFLLRRRRDHSGPASHFKAHPQHTSTIAQADIPKLYSPLQRAAAVFRLALIEGGMRSTSANTTNTLSSTSSATSIITTSDVVGRVPAVVWAAAAESLLENLEQHQQRVQLVRQHHHQQQQQQQQSPSSVPSSSIQGLLLDPASFLAVLSAATVASMAALLKFPCDRALLRFNKVMKIRQSAMIGDAQGRDGGSETEDTSHTLVRLIDELNPKHERPRTSELFDNVNPLIFAEWEKVFAKCCDEALRAPSISMQRLILFRHHDDRLFFSKKNGKATSAENSKHDNDQQQPQQHQQQHRHQHHQHHRQLPKPTRESSLSEKDGRKVIAWLDSTMTATFLFGVDPSSPDTHHPFAHDLNFDNVKGSNSAPTSATPSVGASSRKPSEVSCAPDGESGEKNNTTKDKKRKSEKKGKKSKQNDTKKEGRDVAPSSSGDDGDNDDDKDSEEAQQQWIPIWVSLLPDGAAAGAGRTKEVAVSSLYHGCCGIVCADTSLNCPLRPNDLVFFTPACPEDVQINSQPDVLFPRVVLRAWRLSPRSTALVPNLAIRRLDGTKKSFRLTLTSGEDGHTPLQLCAAACDSELNPSLCHWPLAQWWGFLRELGRREEVKNQTARLRGDFPSSLSSSSLSSHRDRDEASASGASVFSAFGPDFVHSVAKGSMRSLWCSLRDVTIPYLSASRHVAHTTSLYWQIDRNKMGIETSTNSSSGCIWPPPYTSLGAYFGVAIGRAEGGEGNMATSGVTCCFELDSWRSTATLDVADSFLEAAEE